MIFMKIKKILAAGILLAAFGNLTASEITRTEPPYWYTGMKNPQLQIMFYGEGI